MTTPVRRSAETPPVVDPADWLFRSPLASPQADGGGIAHRRTPPGTLLVVTHALLSPLVLPPPLPPPLLPPPLPLPSPSLLVLVAHRCVRPAAVYERHLRVVALLGWLWMFGLIKTS